MRNQAINKALSMDEVETRRRFRALRGLNYPTDPAVVDRLLSGERVPREDRKEKRVEAGDIVDDIPSVSVANLLSRGYIEEVSNG